MDNRGDEGVGNEWKWRRWIKEGYKMVVNEKEERW